MSGARTLGAEHLRRWLRDAAAGIRENRDLLTRLDQEIGDGDHGINMERGFERVVAQLDAMAPKTAPGSSADGTASATTSPAEVLKAAAMTLISSVGGAAGPLYGTFLLRAAAAVAGREALEGADVLAMLEAGLAGVRQRGGAAPGDKTLVDALQPAVDALRQALAEGGDLPAALAAAAAAAQRGARATVPLVARKGRASYLGERSAGHQDPGAASCALLLAALAGASRPSG